MTPVILFIFCYTISMNNIFFIRHGQLEEPYINHLKMDFQTVTDLSTGKLDPSLNSNAKELFVKQTDGVDFSKIKKIYFNSKSHRSEESAKVIKKILNTDVETKGIPELAEVAFNVSELVTIGKYEVTGMQGVREELFQSQLENSNNVESIQEIKQRIDKVFSIIINSKEGSIFVTHDFFMRVIEVYIKKGKLDSITTSDLLDTHLNSYFSGFSTDNNFKSINFFGNKKYE